MPIVRIVARIAAKKSYGKTVAISAKLTMNMVVVIH